MKTNQYLGLRAFAALCAFVTLAIFGFSSSRAVAGTVESPVTLKAFASYSAPVTLEQMRTGAVSQMSEIPSGSLATAKGNFGCLIKAKSGVDGQLTITRLSYDFAINSAPALDGNNAPITNRAFEIYINPGTASTPHIRVFKADGTTQVSTNGAPVPGSSFASAQMVAIESWGFAPTGSIRRPFFTAAGQYYATTFRAEGTYAGIGFNETDTAWVYVAQASTASSGLNIECFTDTTVDLRWSDLPNETGYRVQKSLDGGAIWETIADLPANATTYTVTGLDVAGTNYMFRVTAAGSSLPIGPVAPKRIVSSMTSEGQWVIGVYGMPLTLNDLQFSADLTDWGSMLKGATLSGSAPNYAVTLPMAQPRQFARIKPCAENPAE